MVVAGEERHQRKRLIFVMEERSLGILGYLLFKINVKDLFYSGSFPTTSQSQPRPGDQVVRSLPRPMARFRTFVDRPERIDFALVGGGATIVGVSSGNRTVMYDTRSGVWSAGPEQEQQQDRDVGSYVIELGHRLYAIKRRLTFYHEDRPCGETLPLLADTGSGAPPRWRALPEPAADFRRIDFSSPTCQVTACFTAGTRLWVSAKERGTYSLDTVRRAWRKEGDWELPFHYRGVFVPEIGNLCFGLCPDTRCLCACDMEQSQPVVRYKWEETLPQWPSGIHGILPQGNLSYFGDGKFCISWTIGLDDDSLTRRAIFLMALQVVQTSPGELHMVKHKVCCYEMPTKGEVAYAL